MPNSALTTVEQRTLECCEEDILKGGELIVAALRTIRDQKLYKASYKTFEDYCQTKWNLSPQHTNRLIKHEDTLKNIAEAAPDLEPIGSKMTEFATREIADLPPQQQAEVVREATKVSPKKPTAKAVKETRQKLEQEGKVPSRQKQVSNFFDGKNDSSGQKDQASQTPAIDFTKHIKSAGVIIRFLDEAKKSKPNAKLYKQGLEACRELINALEAWAK